MSDWTFDSVVADARAREGLDDFGPAGWEEPLRVLLASYADAGLSELGASLLRSNVVYSLRTRLRTTEWFARRPEIGDEVIGPPIVVVGMMRSGTTLLQRLLAADPRFHCALNWEVVDPAPKLTHDFTAPDPRIAKALAREAGGREFAADLFAIHPMYAMEAEEEISIFDDAFLSHVPEAYADVPAYRSWIDGQDLTPAYDHLHRTLQLLQWQKRQRGEVRDRWVLKTPQHLGYLDDLRARFPDLHLVHMHRDPVEVVSSGASLNATLHAMHTDHVDTDRIGREWLQRMGWTHDRALATRAAWGAADDPAPVTDIDFEAAVADPIGQVGRVYDALGLALIAEAEAAMRHWLEVRPRETTRRPAYAPEDFGLTADQIRDRFDASRRARRPEVWRRPEVARVETQQREENT